MEERLQALVAKSALEIMANVERANKDSLEANARANAESQAALLELLGPMFRDMTASQQQAKSKEVQAQREADEDEAAAREAEQEMEANHLRLATAASMEQDRVNKLLPPAMLSPEVEARLRGGKSRVEPRVAAARRVLMATKEISEQDLATYEAALHLGHEVNPSPVVIPSPMSMWEVEEGEVEARSSRALFAHLQQNGMAPMTASETALHSVLQVFKDAGVKDSKKKAVITSFKEFNAFVQKAKVITPEAFLRDKDSFFAMLWHVTGVTHINCVHGWPVAQEYNNKIMDDWQRGFLDVNSFVQTEENQKGNVEGALHQRHYLNARMAASTTAS
jgi:hypothetical protein